MGIGFVQTGFLLALAGLARLTRDGASLFDRARDVATTLLADTPPGARVETALFADRVTPIDREDLESQARSPLPTTPPPCAGPPTWPVNPRPPPSTCT